MSVNPRRSSSLSSQLVSVLVASMVTMSMAALVPAKALGASAEAPSPRPRLVVGIIVEGLTADYVDLLRSNMGEGGFNRFIRDGVVIDNVDYGPGIDATAATAILMSGAAPGVNGIPSGRVWDPKMRFDIPVLLPADKAGRYTDADLSPKALQVSTLADEIRIADGGISGVYSIASDPQTAILLAGHAGNSATWISETDGKWTRSTSHPGFPTVLARRNVGLTLASRLDTLSWQPLKSLDSYPDLPAHKKTYPFRYTFPSRFPDRFRQFNASAAGNHEIVTAATDYISGLKLGKREVTDMLALGLDVSPFPYSLEADSRLERMDAYLRLDADIASIIKAVEEGPGMANTLLFIAGTPAPSSVRRDDEKWAIPSGQFSPRKATSLLNMYLIALHGNGEWVNGYHNGFFYLNRNLIKDRDLDERAIRAEAAEFLARMSGVADVYTIDDILARRAGDNPLAIQRNISPSHAGDLMVRVSPGWVVSDSETSVELAQQPVVRWQATTSPVYILSPAVTSTEIGETVDARAIAPTIARILRIRSPNGAALPPLKL
ncbi:MAG: alkaline phosphatase family protein [Duncaniella sp.]|nr:alkaline phosphatase family protein [Duncaniella sp.]